MHVSVERSRKTQRGSLVPGKEQNNYVWVPAASDCQDKRWKKQVDIGVGSEIGFPEWGSEGGRGRADRGVARWAGVVTAFDAGMPAEILKAADEEEEYICVIHEEV